MATRQVDRSIVVLNLIQHLVDRLPWKSRVGINQPGLSHHVEVIVLDNQWPLATGSAMVAFETFHMVASLAGFRE